MMFATIKESPSAPTLPPWQVLEQSTECSIPLVDAAPIQKAAMVTEKESVPSSPRLTPRPSTSPSAAAPHRVCTLQQYLTTRIQWEASQSQIHQTGRVGGHTLLLPRRKSETWARLRDGRHTAANVHAEMCTPRRADGISSTTAIPRSSMAELPKLPVNPRVAVPMNVAAIQFNAMHVAAMTLQDPLQLSPAAWPHCKSGRARARAPQRSPPCGTPNAVMGIMAIMGSGCCALPRHVKQEPKRPARKALLPHLATPTLPAAVLKRSTDSRVEHLIQNDNEEVERRVERRGSACSAAPSGLAGAAAISSACAPAAPPAEPRELGESVGAPLHMKAEQLLSDLYEETFGCALPTGGHAAGERERGSFRLRPPARGKVPPRRSQTSHASTRPFLWGDLLSQCQPMR